MDKLLQEIRKCTICMPHLELGPNPILAASGASRIAIVGQAPGRIVHKTSIPWDDKSGERLRDWLGVDDATFYDPDLFAIIPMGFCYPGKSKTGDLPPRLECAPAWHDQLFSGMKNLELTILIGAYAQGHYLTEKKKPTLTETVRNYEEYLPKYFVLPHPSPRNNIWIKKNRWFERGLIPDLKVVVQSTLKV